MLREFQDEIKRLKQLLEVRARVCVLLCLCCVPASEHMQLQFYLCAVYASTLRFYLCAVYASTLPSWCQLQACDPQHLSEAAQEQLVAE